MTATATENVLNMTETEVIVEIVHNGYKNVYSVDFQPEYETVGNIVTIFDTGTKKVRSVGVSFNQWDESEMTVTNDSDALQEYSEIVEIQNEHKSNVRCVKRWMQNIDNAMHDIYLVRHGKTVEVFKGRKVPKGIYEVTKWDNGTYGLYVNLRDRDGKFYNYVSYDNVRVIPQEHEIKKELTKSSPCDKLGEALWNFVFSKITDLKSWAHYETELLVMCDYIEDGKCGDDVAVLAPIMRAEITRKIP